MEERTGVPGAWDPTWEQVFRSKEWGKYPPEYVVRFVASRWYGTTHREGVRLLDVGCGPGACAWYMAREGFSVSALDGSATAIRRLEGRLAAEGLRADCRVGDAVSLPWPDATFDGVVDNVCLSSNRLADVRRIASEVLRVLKPGGEFISASLSDRSWGYGLGRGVEFGGFTDAREGPMAGKGFGLYLGRAQLDEVFREFCRFVVDRVTWTLDGMAREVEFWIVLATKAS